MLCAKMWVSRNFFGQGPLGIFQVSANGGRKELLIPVSDREEARQPQLLPGGKAVLFMLCTDFPPHESPGSRNWDDARIVVQSLVTGDRKVLVDGIVDARYVPSGHLIYVRGGTLVAQEFDSSKLKVTGEPAPLVEGIVWSTRYGAAQYGVSQAGSLLYLPAPSTEPGRRLAWVNRNGEEELLALPPGPYLGPKISPDGSRLSITIQDRDNSDVWSYDLRRQTMTRITVDPARDLGALWTPDGQRVLFVSYRDGGTPDLYWKAADGSHHAERLSPSARRMAPWSFSPDGKQLVHLGYDPKTSWDLWVLSLEGERRSRPLIQTQFGEYGGAISPDGRWLAYASSESGDHEVYVRPFPDVEKAKIRISREGGRAPVWGPDGRELFYLSRGGTAMMVVRVEPEPVFTAGIPEVLFTGNFAFGPGRLYDITPGGQHFVLLKREDPGEEADTPTELVVVLNWIEEFRRLQRRN